METEEPKKLLEMVGLLEVYTRLFTSIMILRQISFLSALQPELTGFTAVFSSP
jgi:hypothetical protein